MKHFPDFPVWLALGSILAAGGGSVPQTAAPGLTAAAVRVFDGNRFVSDLTLNDFQIEAGGVSAAPSAFILVRRNAAVRREGDVPAWPDLSRRLLILFQLSDYHPKIADALDYLFKEEIQPGDALEIQTPMNRYHLTPEALAAKPRDVLSRELREIVKKDILRGGMGYNSALRDLKTLVRRMGGISRTSLGDTEGDVDSGFSLEQQIIQARESLDKLEGMRNTDYSRLIDFARSLDGGPGRKTVLYVYQREFRPEINPQTLDSMIMANQDRPDILAGLQDLFQLSRRRALFDAAPVRQAFAGSDALFHFLFMTRDPERISGITMKEQSEDIFKSLSSAAAATGGTVNASQNPAASMIEALKASESYYLLLFRPSAGAPAGTFLDLKIEVKNRNFKVFHRTGYEVR